MSKRRKRKARRVRKVVQRIHENRHHLLYQRRFWERNADARWLRNRFIFTIDVDVHNEYHHTIGKNIPIPEDVSEIRKDIEAVNPNLSKAWQACLLLAMTTTDKDFKYAMYEQYNFFAERNI